MQNFEYHAPENLEQAKSLMGQLSDPALLSGGHTLIPTMKLRLAAPGALVDISRLPELQGISTAGDRLSVGAGTTHADVAASALVQSQIPALSRLAGGIGDPHVRARGTIGGSVANNDPAADYPAALLALDAMIETTRKAFRADEFFVDLFETALETNAIVTAISFAIPKRAAYAKFDNPASRYAIAGVFIADFGDRVRVAVTGAGAVVFRVEALESALASNFDSRAIADFELPADGLNDDVHASPQYRAALVKALAQDAVVEICGSGI